jgi:hypothetical protein
MEKDIPPPYAPITEEVTAETTPLAPNIPPYYDTIGATKRKKYFQCSSCHMRYSFWHINEKPKTSTIILMILLLPAFPLNLLCLCMKGEEYYQCPNCFSEGEIIQER